MRQRGCRPDCPWPLGQLYRSPPHARMLLRTTGLQILNRKSENQNPFDTCTRLTARPPTERRRRCHRPGGQARARGRSRRACQRRIDVHHAILVGAMISRQSLAFFCGAGVLMLMAPIDAFAQAGCTLSAPYETIRTDAWATTGQLPLTATGSCPSSLNTSSTASWLSASAWVAPSGAWVYFSTEANPLARPAPR